VDEYLLSIIKRTKMKMQQSQSDPCIFYKHEGGKLVLILVLYVDDTLCAGEKEEVEWAYKTIESELKIKRQRQLKKHLGIWYIWKKDKTGKTYMPKTVKEICKKFEAATGEKAKKASTSTFTGKYCPLHLFHANHWVK
jgi:hypothetical protein